MAAVAKHESARRLSEGQSGPYSRSPQGFQLFAKRGPILPVGLTLGQLLSQKPTANSRQIGGEGTGQQRSDCHQPPAYARVIFRHFHKELRRSQLADPKLHSRPDRVCPVLKVMRFHKAAN